MEEAYVRVERGGKSLRSDSAPPDGGWGYAVCVGVGLMFMLGFGSSSAFGILFNKFFAEQGGAGDLTVVVGVYNGAQSIAGFLSGIALKHYSFRQVGLVGAGLFVLGDILTIFVARTYQLVFTFGLIRGAGFGVMIPVSFTAFNCYFFKKRTAMMSANQAMSSLASITFPILVTFLLAEYSFRGTLALIMALDLHIVFAMLVMHPVEWHLVKPSRNLVPVLEIEDMNTEEITEREDPKCKMLHSNSPTQGPKLSKNNGHVSFQKNIVFFFITAQIKISSNIEVRLLKDPKFLSILMSLCFVFVSDVTYLAIEPMLLFSYGFSELQVATCVMAGALADLVMRLLLAIFTYFYPVDSRKLFLIGTCITVILRIALVSYDNIWYVYVVTIASGLVRCSVQVLYPLVLASVVPSDHFPGALALHIIFSGVLALLADPLIGVIYVLTGSYVYCFVALSCCCLISVVLWIIEYIHKHKTLRLE